MTGRFFHGNGYLYAIGHHWSRLKVGHTADIENRLQMFNNECNRWQFLGMQERVRYRVFAVHPGTKADERLFHRSCCARRGNMRLNAETYQFAERQFDYQFSKWAYVDKEGVEFSQQALREVLWTMHEALMEE